jgi:3-hydroxyacyl-[acyl-carrier-protein] dehydratase
MSDTGSTPAEVLDYDIVKILKALPHRYPLLLVDRVRSIMLQA